MNNDTFYYTPLPSLWDTPTKPQATSPFLVFADATGFKAPTYKHYSREAAEQEARRLADLNPGVSYYVLGSLSYTRAPKAPKATTRSLV